MFQLQIYQVPILAIGIPAGLALVRYLMVYVGFRVMLSRARPTDYPAVYRAYVRGLAHRGPRIADVIKIIRSEPPSRPDPRVHREPSEPRPGRAPVAR
jgi:transcriptional regulator of nitric oxide reductase